MEMPRPFKAAQQLWDFKRRIRSLPERRGRESNLKNQGYCLQIFYILWNKIHILEGGVNMIKVIEQGSYMNRVDKLPGRSVFSRMQLSWHPL